MGGPPISQREASRCTSIRTQAQGGKAPVGKGPPAGPGGPSGGRHEPRGLDVTALALAHEYGGRQEGPGHARASRRSVVVWPDRLTQGRFETRPAGTPSSRSPWAEPVLADDWPTGPNRRAACSLSRYRPIRPLSECALGGDLIIGPGSTRIHDFGESRSFARFTDFYVVLSRVRMRTIVAWQVRGGQRVSERSVGVGGHRPAGAERATRRWLPRRMPAHERRCLDYGLLRTAAQSSADGSNVLPAGAR